MKKIPKYNFKSVERRWQKRWEQDKIFQPDMDKAKKPFYNLMMFPYPSAEGLHVGAAYTYSGVDTFGRFKKLQGYDVFEPMGLDGFGIHSENYAMKIGEHIKDVSRRTEKNFYRQLHQLGNMHDWSRTVETYKPEYYKWTQWLFLQMFKKGLAYQKVAKVNWCPSCMTVLSDEQVIQGQCERCESFVEKKELKQWFFRITKYAEKLLRNLDWIDWPEDIKTNQRNWIGKSEGALIKFQISNFKFQIKSKKQIPNSKNFTHYSLPTTSYLEVFTTRPDTLFGATYMVVGPEHSLIQNSRPEAGQPLAKKFKVQNWKEVEKYLKRAVRKTEEERKATEKQKTGVEIKGIKAINPATGEAIPIWVADYVLAGYGTGAIMAVPAHDERDFEFAKKFGLPIKQVVVEDKKQTNSSNNKQQTTNCFTGEGVAVNSGFLNGLETSEAKKEMIKWLAKENLGKKSVDYKLRDWCVSRQRYWGPPIPIVFCKHCALHNRQQTTDNRQQKVKVLMIHGFEGSGKGNWFPWMKQELENSGCQVFAPTMKTSQHPKVENWVRELKPYLNKLGEGDVIIAHSLGSKAALHLLDRYQKSSLKLFLVASAIGEQKRDWEWLQKRWPTSDIESLKEFWAEKINWSSINDDLLESHIIISKDDPYITVDHHKAVKLKNLQLNVWDKFKHFQNKKEELLKEYIISNIVKDLEPVAVPVPEQDLPVKLPPMEDFLPEGKGKGPLAKNEKFVHTKCPECGADAERETDVSDPFVDSSWYFFRYPSTDVHDKPFDKKRTKKWLPVDSYIGGKEHTVLHLFYSRFVTMVLNDLGHIDFDEPYKRFFGHGLITKDGAKMSKSKGNVVNPDEMVEKFGADTMRLYLRFLGDFSQGGDWRDSGIEGMKRFVTRAWNVFYQTDGSGKGIENMSMVDKTIKSIGEDIEKLSFNTSIARLMEYVNWLRDNSGKFDKQQALKVKETLAFVLAPMAPHIAEEFFSSLGNTESIFTKTWPKFDSKKIIEQTIELVVQVNGKVRDKLVVSKDVTEDEARAVALESDKVQNFISNKEVKKIIYVPGRLVSIVV